jgi:hypothetical protein
MLDLLIDNDVLIKCACYDLLNQISVSNDQDGDVGILGAAPFVVRNHLKRRGVIKDRVSAQRRFEAYLETALVLEPTEGELAFASTVEEMAMLLGLDMDFGESQLCAIAIFRISPLLLTGDKRAVAAAESLLGQLEAFSSLEGRIVCLEQIVMGVASRIGLLTTRTMICAEPGLDKSLSICFQCTACGDELANLSAEGLLSYISALRNAAPRLLYELDGM